MKVLNLHCALGHGFEGWFGSEADFLRQQGQGLITCPLCADATITRLPSAPRLNLSGARAPQADTEIERKPAADVGPAAASPVRPEAQRPPRKMVPAALQAQWLLAVQQVLRDTEDVGERFPEEARRIHYGESAQRGIRGQASAQERAALADEGIEVMALPVPAALKGPSH